MLFAIISILIAIFMFNVGLVILGAIIQGLSNVFTKKSVRPSMSLETKEMYENNGW